jgi:hypothetical protein
MIEATLGIRHLGPERLALGNEHLVFDGAGSALRRGAKCEMLAAIAGLAAEWLFSTAGLDLQ